MDGAPVIDANGLLIKMAELFVDLRRQGQIAKPTRGYYNRRPGDEQIDHLLTLFAPKIFDLDSPER